MKRSILFFLVLSLLSPFVFGQGTTTIGLVTFRTDALNWEIDDYATALSDDLGITVIGREVKPAEFCFDDEMSANLSRISHSVGEIIAINELLGEGIEGVVLTPAPETEALKPEIFEVMDQVPVVLTTRKAPGVDAPFFGFDTYQLGLAWARSMEAHETVTFVVLGYFDDPLQADLLAGLETSPGFAGSYEILFQNGSAEASDAVLDVPNLGAIIVTDQRYAPGVAEIIQYAQDELGQSIKLGSFGVPEGWVDLFDQNLLHGAFSWDNYEILHVATQGLLQMISGGATPEDVYFDLFFYTGSSDPVTLAHPFDQFADIGDFWAD